MGVFCCVVSSHFCGKMIPFYKHTRSSGWIKYQHVDVFCAVNGIVDFVNVSFRQIVCIVNISRNIVPASEC